ncbi:oxygenase MpaB family protein [Kitasatospora sp. NPDC049258]|uniref:oxygenase MpaB family protein n=1 Tax=Kitasatospora sp. NPDC049258 TaxID=3155394 RepID=UPI0034295B88
MTRRQILGTAAMVGATTLLGGGTAASAARAASGPGSARATAAEVDPRERAYLESLKQIADPQCDEAVTEAFERGQGAAVNDALKGWRTNGQAIPDGLPAKLRDFLETTRQLPAWVDPEALAAGHRFGLAHAQQISFAAVLDVTPERMRYPAAAAAITGIEGPHDNKQGFAKALRAVGDILHKEPYGPDGSAFVTPARVRMAHSAVRHLLHTEGHWDTGTWGLPVNQLDLLAEGSLFTSYLIDHLDKLGVHPSEQEAEHYFHECRVGGYLMGISEDGMPPTLAAARKRAAAVNAIHARVTPQSAEYVKTTIEYFSSLAGPKEITVPPATALVRYMIGDADADAFGLARSTWDAVVPTAVQGFFTGTQAGGLPTPSATMTRLAVQMVQRAMNDGKEIDLTMPLHLYGHR